ncbi:MAG TPA: UDP-N-acetylmuramate dehydrogenase [Chitinophagaceae bacterium]|nr:UDP-N-acetylmuramate dehydrogenase [Chitinophagaceae bacterium]
MQFSENISLAAFNSFGIDVKARYFTKISSVDELSNLPLVQNLPLLVLGGGSNILFTGDFNGYVIHNQIRGIEVVHEDDDHVIVKTGAGEVWHEFVEYCINNSLAGVENMALIPGRNGASPIQNIGAYGVEVKDVFHELEAYHLFEKKLYRFSASDCDFGYRDSVFKNKYKGQFLISSVTYRLNKKPSFQTAYGAIQQELEKMGVQDLSIRAVGDAVIRIRRSKLPDPAVIGNAGSFFKNPEISAVAFEKLKSAYPDIVGYPLPGGSIKLAAGWMIEKAGWKGYRKGQAGVHDKQALVLVNHGGAKGKEIYDLSEEILVSVREKFGVRLEREVNIL